MLLLILLQTVAFIFFAFFANQPTTQIQNPFIRYYIAIGQFLLENWVTFSLIIFILTFFLIRSLKHHTHTPFRKKFLFTTYHIGITALIGSFFAFIILLVIAFIQLNILSTVVNSNPAIMGIVTDNKIIAKTLSNRSKPPTIIANTTNGQKALYALAAATTGNTNLYGGTIIPAVPEFLIIPLQDKQSGLLLIDNTLIFTKMKLYDLQVISPDLGYLYVQDYFQDRKIKPLTKFSIMNKQEYLQYRQFDTALRMTRIESYMLDMQESVSSVSGSIQNEQGTIQYLQNMLKQAVEKRTTQYSTCKSTGVYQGGVFRRTYSDSQCKDSLAQTDATLKSMDTDIKNRIKKLENDKNLLTEYKAYTDFFNSLEKTSQILKSNIPHELGVFEPGDTVKVALDQSNPFALTNYFETLTHEYLHFASYNDERKLADSFFEEGMAEYFSRKIIKNNLGIDTNLGYPVYVKIIEEMLKIIPESDLADIFFSKDENTLIATLNRVYGDNFYQNNRVLFETLQYTNNKQEVLQLANTIMKKIGGTPLTEQDLMSTNSN